MKRCLMSLTLREMEINIAMRDQFTSIRMTVTKKKKITSVGDDVGKVGRGIKEARLSYVFDTVNHVMSKGSFSSEEEACDFLGFDVKEYQEAKEQFKEENGSSDQN